MCSSDLMAPTSFQAPVVSMPVRAPAVSMADTYDGWPSPGKALPFTETPAALDGSMPGDVGFDPMGFSDPSLGPFDSAEAHMGWMREAEIKHGRICMLGTVGWISTDLGLRAPGVPAELKSASLTSFAAHDVAVSDGRLLMLLIVCGVFEIAGSAAIQATIEGKRAPGDFALMGGFSKADDKKLAALKQAEIKHCRLGMMAFSGLATQTAVASAAGGVMTFPYF